MTDRQYFLCLVLCKWNLTFNLGYVNAHCDIRIGIENVYAEIHEMVQVCNCGAPLGTHF